MPPLTLLVPFVALLLVLGAAAALAVFRRARSIAAAVRRVRAQPGEPRSSYPSLAVVPARHLRTALAPRHGYAELEEFPSGLEGTLAVTERELVLEAPDGPGFHLPLSRVADSRFLGTPQEGAGGAGGATLLRIEWECGGEPLSSTFEILGSRLHAEKIRREIQLRTSARALVSLTWPGAGA